jgi:thiamine-phosphate pyrophosphorylase
MICEAGVDIIQLRDKQAEASALCRAAEEFRAAATMTGALFIVNDRPDVALATGADGVHLGQDDLPLPVARAILGPSAIIGRSTHDLAQVEAALGEDCDYFCVGPVWPTPTKPGRPAVGLELLRQISTERPWFAIGGIDPSNTDTVREAGAARVVVARAIAEAADPVAAAQQLRKALE